MYVCTYIQLVKLSMYVYIPWCCVVMPPSCAHRAETATKIKLERVAEIKRLNAQIMSVRRFVPCIHMYILYVLYVYPYSM